MAIVAQLGWVRKFPRHAELEVSHPEHISYRNPLPYGCPRLGHVHNPVQIDLSVEGEIQLGRGIDSGNSHFSGIEPRLPIRSFQILEPQDPLLQNHPSRDVFNGIESLGEGKGNAIQSHLPIDEIRLLRIFKHGKVLDKPFNSEGYDPPLSPAGNLPQEFREAGGNDPQGKIFLDLIVLKRTRGGEGLYPSFRRSDLMNSTPPPYFNLGDPKRDVRDDQVPPVQPDIVIDDKLLGVQDRIEDVRIVECHIPYLDLPPGSKEPRKIPLVMCMNIQKALDPLHGDVGRIVRPEGKDIHIFRPHLCGHSYLGPLDGIRKGMNLSDNRNATIWSFGIGLPCLDTKGNGGING